MGAVSAPPQVAPSSSRARSAAAPLIADYLSSLQVERGAARNTLMAYRRDLAGFDAFLAAGGHRLESVGVTELSRYLAGLRGRGLGGRSIARHLSAVRGLLDMIRRRRSVLP